MNIITTHGHGTGGEIDRIDTRDFKFEEVGFATPVFNWDVGFDIETKLGITLPVKDQGVSGSCGGQAWSNLAGVLEAANDGNLEERSAKFIYAQTYAPGGGSYGRDNCNIYVNQGAARESVLPSYELGKPPSEAFMERGQDIFASTRDDARSDVSSAYAFPQITIDEIARAIRDTNGVVILIEAQDNGTWLSPFPQPPTKTAWRHFLYLGKGRMISGKKHIGALNSWGKSVGYAGWQYLSEDYFTSGHITQAYTHIFNTTPIPTSFKYNFMVNLSFGTQSVDNSKLQTALQIEGIFPQNVSPTGFFGQITANAVLTFRAKYGVSSANDPQGHSVGPLTRAQLNKIFN